MWGGKKCGRISHTQNEGPICLVATASLMLSEITNREPAVKLTYLHSDPGSQSHIGAINDSRVPSFPAVIGVATYS